MNKTSLSRHLAAKMSISQAETNRFITALQETITEELQNNSTLMLQGFGTFVPWEQTERSGRNPRTGTPCTIRKRTSVKFKPGKHLLKALNDSK